MKCRQLLGKYLKWTLYNRVISKRSPLWSNTEGAGDKIKPGFEEFKFKRYFIPIGIFIPIFVLR